MLVSSVCSQARILALCGEREEALAGLEDAYAFASREGMPHFRIIAAATVGEFLLLDGDVDGCLSWVAREDLERALEKNQLWFSRPWLETEALVRLFTLLRICQDALNRAYDLPHEFAVRARQAGRKLMSARAELLLVDVALKQNRLDVALLALNRAVDDTEGSTALRPFFEMSEAGISLLKSMRKRKGQPHVDRLNHILHALEADSGPEGRSAEIMSPRQKDVLTGLSCGQPTKIIARNLDLSYETVRHHLKRIYTKLGVHNRGQAVDEARRRRIIT
jgi:ATP/maltotriose-dependent transcriptional regulator MalT